MTILNLIKDSFRTFKREHIRFLGYGKPHVPSVEERVAFAWESGFKAGVKALEERLKQDVPSLIERLKQDMEANQ